MKKLYIFIVLVLFSFGLIACESTPTIKVIATSIPHGEILEAAKPLLKEKGYELEIILTSDYYLPNPAVAANNADANFFQHVPFLNKYNQENPTKKLIIASKIHIEPIGIYSKNITSIENIPNGATVLLSNSSADHGRALNLLRSAGLITLSDSFDILSTNIDFEKVITQNPKNLVFKTNVSPDFMISAYQNNEADLYIINSNYVLEGGLSPKDDSIFIESTIDNPFVNILAVKEENLNSEKIKILKEVLESQTIKDFITNKYKGSVIPA